MTNVCGPFKVSRRHMTLVIIITKRYMMKREQTFLSDLDWISLRLVRIFALTLQNIDKSL